ncbi:cobyrinic acid ac-diamide synthase [Kitasatospora sp. MMS16-BH015]|uniref:cobyrinate a,c-diamide synthase n=1 Tax=Kitasatospora sp. MMS16-BH015 TaxID=2018025 RepID=UPI000CA13DD1|nr:cobyrinate a,c-diamide synthase [Kitasatospora sp. MMS16-BH015]AUG80257.1 cobyrinic acid ac-diamide synthase [Kitasatospora sp. MMS16-BH015]
MNIPRLVIAAPSSGAGKTTIATGLMAALTARGLRVSPHKVGPDYIDPGYHGLAAGRPGRNLDAFMCGPDRVAPLFRHGAAGADVAIVEGVMGLFDGAAGRGELASTAHVAKLLKAPVVLVVDASSQSRSVAALVHGFASWDPEVRLAGVILNRVASDRHEQLLREALEEGSGVPVLGAVRRASSVATPSRHLGLVPAVERSAEAVSAVRDMGELVAASVDLDAVMALARSAPSLGGPVWSAAEEVSPVSGRPRVALAAGAAFSFSYAENAELLAAAGAEVVPFDPLHDEQLPAGTRGLVIGGGFPEMYVAELSGNAALRAEIAALAASGAPISAECAGLLYLGRELDGAPMCGVLGGSARMTSRLTLGYREAVALGDSVLAPAGTRVRGHEFHRTVVEPGAGEHPAWGWRGPDGAARTEGFVQGSVHASYLHLHWAGAPELAAHFVGRIHH